MQSRLWKQFKTRKNTVLRVFLLRTCPYSKKLADALRGLPRVEKKWVSHGSAAYHDLKQRYDWPTFPIAVLCTRDEEVRLGGWDDLRPFLL